MLLRLGFCATARIKRQARSFVRLTWWTSGENMNPVTLFLSSLKSHLYPSLLRLLLRRPSCAGPATAGRRRGGVGHPPFPGPRERAARPPPQEAAVAVSEGPSGHGGGARHDVSSNSDLTHHASHMQATAGTRVPRVAMRRSVRGAPSFVPFLHALLLRRCRFLVLLSPPTRLVAWCGDNSRLCWPASRPLGSNFIGEHAE